MCLLSNHDQGVLKQSCLIFNGRRRPHSVRHAFKDAAACSGTLSPFCPEQSDPVQWVQKVAGRASVDNGVTELPKSIGCIYLRAGEPEKPCLTCLVLLAEQGDIVIDGTYIRLTLIVVLKWLMSSKSIFVLNLTLSFLNTIAMHISFFAFSKLVHLISPHCSDHRYVSFVKVLYSVQILRQPHCPGAERNVSPDSEVDSLRQPTTNTSEHYLSRVITYHPWACVPYGGGNGCPPGYEPTVAKCCLV